MLMSLGFWGYYFMKTFGKLVKCDSAAATNWVVVYGPLRECFKEENRSAQLRRIIDLQVNPIQGLGSKWDYEKDEWKK